MSVTFTPPVPLKLARQHVVKLVLVAGTAQTVPYPFQLPVHWDWLVSTQCVPMDEPQTTALGGRQQAPRQREVVHEVDVVMSVPAAPAHWAAVTSTHEPFGRQQGFTTGGQGLGVQVELPRFVQGPKQKA